MWQRYAIGAASERRVSRLLEASNVGYVLDSVDLGAGGDADHIVVGYGITVVETKTGTGVVRSDHAGMYVGDRKIKGDPVRQATRQAALVHDITGVWVEAVVCVVDMKNSPFADRGTTICSLADLPKVVSRNGKALDQVRVQHVVDALHQAANGPKL